MYHPAHIGRGGFDQHDKARHLQAAARAAGAGATNISISSTHCVNMRQNIQLRLRTSTYGSIVAPVVVKPETVSNTASR